MLMKHKTYGLLCCGLLCCLFLCVMMLFPSVKAYASDSNIRSVDVHLRVMCVCEDDRKEFTYTLSPETMKYQNIDKTTFTLSCDHAEAFGITYTYPGTYRYTIAQTVGTDNTVMYDTTMYHVVVYVTDDGSDALMANVIAYKDGSDEKVEDISFRNVYHGPSQNGPNNTLNSSVKPSVRPVNANTKQPHMTSSQNQSAPNVQTSDTGTMFVYLLCILVDVLVILSALIRKRGASDET